MNIKKSLIVSCTTLILSACGQAGWKGYYQTYPETTTNKYIAESVINTTILNPKTKKEIWLEMPRDCDSLFFAGIITPFTPPIPLFSFRSWTSAGKNGDGMCHYFIAQTRPATKVLLKVSDKIYEPKELEGEFGYTKYIFPIRAKNLDSGTLIVEKDGEKIEVPFEYKYYKFWY